MKCNSIIHCCSFASGASAKNLNYMTKKFMAANTVVGCDGDKSTPARQGTLAPGGLLITCWTADTPKLVRGG